MELFQHEDDESGPDAESLENAMTTGDPVAILAVGSILFSWYKFYVKGDAHAGIFTGLWAPTLFAAANYVQQKDVIRRVREAL